MYGPLTPWSKDGQVVTNNKSLATKIKEAAIAIGEAIVYIITFKWLF